MVTVGNPGNAPDTRYNGISVGSVTTPTRSASTKSRPASTPSSSTPWPRPTPTGFTTRRWAIPVGIDWAQTSSEPVLPPTYSYSVAADWANRPVNYVSFWDAARFANWLHNGQPTGAQGPGTTEGGAYHDVGNQTLFGRNAGAKFFIPTEDVLQGALLGLVALLLAFGLSLAVGRYQSRRDAVVSESNAIGTTYLRAQTLNEPARTRSLDLLRRYTDDSIVLSHSIPGSSKAAADAAAEDVIQRQLWRLGAHELTTRPAQARPASTSRRSTT